MTLMTSIRQAIGEPRWLDIKLRLGRINKNTYYHSLAELVMQRVLVPDSVCVDVGCHAGVILRLMMRYAPNGQFLAFEPIPELAAKLHSNFNLPTVTI